MGNLQWDVRRNLENSLKDFLDSQISSSNLTVFHEGNNLPINVQVGHAETDAVALPVLYVYCEDKTSTRGFVGSNRRLKEWTMVIDIYALDNGMRSDLAEWVQTTINDGWTYYTYSPDAVTPNTPTKVEAGLTEVSFVTDTPVRLENVSEYEKYRHNIFISVDINGSGF